MYLTLLRGTSTGGCISPLTIEDDTSATHRSTVHHSHVPRGSDRSTAPAHAHDNNSIRPKVQKD